MKKHKVKGAFEHPFQSERLRKLAHGLIEYDAKQKIELIEDSVNIIGSKLINIIPVYAESIDAIPVIFNTEWVPTPEGAIWKEDWRKNQLSSICSFFGLESIEMFLHIFSPYAQQISKYGGSHLERKSTTTDLANNILVLLELRRNSMPLVPQIKGYFSKN